MTRAEELEKSLTDFLIGNPVIFDDKGNPVKLCDIPPTYRIEYIECKNFTFNDLRQLWIEQQK